MCCILCVINLIIKLRKRWRFDDKGSFLCFFFCLCVCFVNVFFCCLMWCWVIWIIVCLLMVYKLFECFKSIASLTIVTIVGTSKCNYLLDVFCVI